MNLVSEFVSHDDEIHTEIYHLKFIFRNIERSLLMWGLISCLEGCLYSSISEFLTFLSEKLRLSYRQTYEYLLKMRRANLIAVLHIPDGIQIMALSSFPFVYSLWQQNKEAFEVLSKQKSFYALFLLWQMTTFPDEDASSLLDYATKYYGISKSTFQRSIKILRSLDLIRKRGRGLQPTNKGKVIIEELDKTISVGFVEFSRSLDYGWLLIV